MTEETDTSKTLELSRVAFRAPEFWESDPELWFGQVESQFIIAGITVDETKFHSVIAALNAKILSCARDLVRSPPVKDKYETIKERILSTFSQSDTSKLKCLLQDCQLGDKRPSQLLLEMRNLAADRVSDDVLKSLWSQRLPLNLQQILSASSEKLDGLANIADKVTEVSGCAISINEMSNTAQNSLDLKSLKDEIVSLRAEIGRISRSQTRTFNRFRSSSSRRRSRSKSQNSSFCWYHAKFGKKARKCVEPCTYSENL